MALWSILELHLNVICSLQILFPIFLHLVEWIWTIPIETARNHSRFIKNSKSEFISIRPRNRRKKAVRRKRANGSSKSRISISNFTTSLHNCCNSTQAFPFHTFVWTMPSFRRSRWRFSSSGIITIDLLLHLLGEKSEANFKQENFSNRRRKVCQVFET